MEIKYSKQATKFLAKQSKINSDRITKAINNLPLGDVKKLQNSAYYRLRVGDYRVIFDKDFNIIYVLKIDNRGQIYKSWEKCYV